eukprot:CAMPEP_0175784594 /NCGR_PEP_ID=MMETSP0097-20121207/78894_1 /TAXON_ID=311494 /ORGANISM="Alexandrium monilatum, Strain CCMP3105" /LENGTH=75 /DNA_ID=CAMNT_0017095481 /DNA_START=1 /DNA_END=225 /DNA_ORIENTATION=-
MKRLMKQVPVLKEEECRQRVVQLLTAPPPPGAGPVAESVSLACPATGLRLRLPGRGAACRHLQCFDVDNHLANKA